MAAFSHDVRYGPAAFLPASEWHDAKGAVLIAPLHDADKRRDRRGETLFIDARKMGVLIDRIHRELTTEEIKKILASPKKPYEKKIALFNLVVKKVEVGDMPSEKKKRVNHLLESCLFNELAKQSMEEYKKTTVEIFNNSKQSKQL